MEADKNEADARDVRAHLDIYLERAQGGETITITDEGVPVGRLLPPKSSESTRDRRDELQETGLVEWNGVLSFFPNRRSERNSLALGSSP